MLASCREGAALLAAKIRPNYAIARQLSQGQFFQEFELKLRLAKFLFSTTVPPPSQSPPPLVNADQGPLHDRCDSFNRQSTREAVQRADYPRTVAIAALLSRVSLRDEEQG